MLFFNLIFHRIQLQDSAYEEIQERLQTPGNAVDSIYVTAGMHTDVTSVHYSTINFQSHSREAGGEEVNPSTSACEYSTVDFRKRHSSIQTSRGESLLSSQ